MSTVKANNVQVGQSVTATNNFTLYQPATPDGTVRLGVGNTGATTADAVTVTNAGNVTALGSLTGTAVTASGAATVASLVVNSNNISAVNSLGFRNRLINGDMRVAQRGTSVALGTTPTYFVDRFAGLYSTSVTGTLTQQSTGGLSGFTNCARAQRTSGQTATGNLSVVQILETLNCTDLAGGSITISFWARAGSNYSAPSSGLTAAVYTGTGTDQSSTSFMAGSWTGQTAIVNSGITLTTSWQRFTATGSVGSSATQLGIIFQAALTGTAGANDYFEVTGVQLEAGSVATPFERVEYGAMLRACQRYYSTSGGELVGATSGAAVSAMTNGSDTGSARGSMRFPVTMRATPTVTLYNNETGASGGVVVNGVGYYTNCVAASISVNGFGNYLNNSNNYPTSVRFVTAFYFASAEF